MGKSKRGPSLFELLRSEPGQPLGPALTSRLSARTEGPSARLAPSRPSGAGLPLAATEGGEAKDRNGAAPFVQLEGDRLCLTLTPATAAVAIFAVAVLLLGAFVWGHRRGDEAGFVRGRVAERESYATRVVDEIEAARNQPPATHLTDGLLVDSAGRPAASVPRSGEPGKPAARTGEGGAPVWVPGLTYVVAQEFGTGKVEDARRAQAFLAERGMPAAVVQLEGGAIQLITTQGFNHKDPAQKQMHDQLLQKERAAGTAYYAGGGGYKLEGYYKTLKREKW